MNNNKKAILVVSFGTSYNNSRDLTIGAIEDRIQQAYPDYEVRRAFTSEIIIGILASREQLYIDNVDQAMARLAADGISEVVVQPTHVMSGYEYHDMLAAIQAYEGRFDSLKIGTPLLTSAADYEKVIAVLAAETGMYDAADTAIIFMGHGTEHSANEVYLTLQERIRAAGHNHMLIGTVEADPDLEAIIGLVKESAARKVVLVPLMIVAGDHATNDMAGSEEDSWKSRLEALGYQVEVVLKGMGQYQGIQDIYVEHVAAAM